MDEKQLDAFVTLSQELHFTRAAERLRISQPVMSQLIRRFEKECGVALVERTTRSVSLTAAGRSVLPHAKRALQELRLISRSAALDGRELSGTVELGYAGASSRAWLPAIARAVRERHPGIDLQLRSMVYAGTSPGLVASGDLDIAFSRRPMAHPGLVEDLFEYERVMAAVPSDHPLARHTEIDVAELADEPWITFPAAQGSSVRDMCMRLAGQAGFTPHVAQEAPDSYTILGLVAAGAGVTLTLSSLEHVSTNGLSLINLAGPSRYLVATVIHSKRASQATLAVADIVRSLRPHDRRPQGQILE